MKLTNLIIEKLKTDMNLRLKVALAIGRGEQSVKQNIDRNNNNNKLTTTAAVRCLIAETGLTEQEILTDEPALAQ